MTYDVTVTPLLPPLEQPIRSLSRKDLKHMAQCRALGVMFEAGCYANDQVHIFLHGVGGYCTEEDCDE